jgi:hypothetical protein
MMNERDMLLDALYLAHKDKNSSAANEIKSRLKALDAAKKPLKEESNLENIGSFLKENMELPVGIGSGIASGVAAGSMFGPIGGVVGGVVGGALGSGAGSLISNYLMDEKLDYTEATEEALMSAGMDIATLGTFKAAKTGLKAAGYGKEEIADIVLNKFQPVREAFTAGSQASLRATQELLERGGGSLSAFQTGASSGFRKAAESVADLGLFSRNIGESRRAANSSVLQTEINRLIEGKLGNVDAGAADIGSEIFGIIEGARKAAIDAYGRELSIVKESMGNTPVSTRSYTKKLTKLLNDNTIAAKTEVVDGVTRTTPLSYSLDKRAVALAKEYNSIFSQARSVQPKNLFEFEKKITNEISEAGQYGSGVSTAAQADLVEVRAVFRDAADETLSAVNPQALERYKNLNKVYGETMDGLLPSINETAVSRANNQGYYEAIGSLAVDQGNVSKVKSLMRSIDKSFAVLKRENRVPEGVAKSAEDAKDLIRQGYLKRIFGDPSGSFNIKKLSNEALRLEKPTASSKAKVIMGDTYPEYKQLMNAMLEATNEPSGFFGSLVLRSREATSITGLASSTTQTSGTVVAGLFGGIGAAAVVLGVPVLMSVIATNKPAIRKLLAMNTQSKKLSGEALTAFVTSGLAKIIEDLPEEDKAVIRQSGRQ